MVSQDFILLRHSSPSFGSQHVCSNSNLSPKIMIGRWCPPQLRGVPTAHFHCASEFATQTLAHMLDSLVRVSRRAAATNFVRPARGPRGLGDVSLARRQATSSPAVCGTKTQAARTARSDKTRPRGAAEDRRRAHFVEALPFGRFQALFNSLFKVLCIFPSRYLFAIGLAPIFSFRWNLPPT